MRHKSKGDDVVLLLLVLVVLLLLRGRNKGLEAKGPHPEVGAAAAGWAVMLVAYQRIGPEHRESESLLLLLLFRFLVVSFVVQVSSRGRSQQVCDIKNVLFGSQRVESCEIRKGQTKADMVVETIASVVLWNVPKLSPKRTKG